MQEILESLKDPELREELRKEEELDDLEQRMFDLSKRIDALRPRYNVKVRVSVRVGLAQQRLDSRKRREP